MKSPNVEFVDHEEVDGMRDDTAVVARLLERAQCGEHAEVLRLAEEALGEPTGDLAGGPAGMHFVRFVALVVQGRSGEALGAIDLMLKSAEREGSNGWRSCALSGRAYQRLMIGEQLADHDVYIALQDLVDAEIALARGVEDSVIAENAHTGVALGYHQLRLYELALPQYEAAYIVSPRDGRQTGNRAMWQSNIATLHLEWALSYTGWAKSLRPNSTALPRARTRRLRSSRRADPMPKGGVRTPSFWLGALLPTAPTRRVRRGTSRIMPWRLGNVASELRSGSAGRSSRWR